jgi:hypothetical protein
MNTDDNDFGESGGEDCGEDVEFVLVPGGYGFERVRLRMEPEVQPNQNLFTTEGTEDTEPPQHAKTARAGDPREKGLPRMSADCKERRAIEKLNSCLGQFFKLNPTPFWDDLG